MEDCGSPSPTNEGEEHVIAAAWHVVKALGATKNLTDGTRRILEELDNQLSTMAVLTESRCGVISEVEEQIKCVEKKIMRWESKQSMIWDSGPEEASDYLRAVGEVQKLTESLGSLSMNENGKRRELVHRAQSVLQMAMSRLEKELIHILVQKKQIFEAEYMSFHSCEEDAYEESIVSMEDDSSEDTSPRRSNGNESDGHAVALVHPDVIPDLKAIATVMIASNYAQEFFHSFVSVRRDAFDEYLLKLEIAKLSIVEMLKMDWRDLSCKVKEWVQAMKIVVRVYLASEKRLCKQILGEFEPASQTCFVKATAASMSYLLSFGEAVAVGSRATEKLFRLLDMYEVLSDLVVDIDGLFAEETGSFVRNGSHELLRSLGDSSRATFMEFKNAIATNGSANPFPGGGVHHLTKYVMNYITTLIEFVDALNVLLKDCEVGNLDPVAELENGQENCSDILCPMARHLRSVTSILEYNLEAKSKLYKDCSLQHIFLMNNIHYMVQKVKGSKLGVFFGDEWIRKHIGKFRLHAKSYERATWSSVLSLLRDDGNPGCSVMPKATLKERCRSFGVAFENVYKRQTAWLIPDPQLREDLRISTSQKVILAYRSFIGRYSFHIHEKNIKFSADDLEIYLLDLFEGSSRSLRPAWRR